MKILCATDLLRKSEAAIDRAAMLAHALGADLSLVHVVPWSADEEALERRAQRARTVMTRFRLPLGNPSPAPNVLLRTGNPAAEVVAILQDVRPDLLVLGPHDRDCVADALSGSIVEKILGSRSCPVLVVRHEPATAYRNVLLALDLSPVSEEVVEAAESLVGGRV